jgi:hypothetical protein
VAGASGRAFYPAHVGSGRSNERPDSGDHRPTPRRKIHVRGESPKAREREVRGLLKASRDLRCQELLLLTDSEEGAARERWQGYEAEVRRHPVWKWLLEQG